MKKNVFTTKKKEWKWIHSSFLLSKYLLTVIMLFGGLTIQAQADPVKVVFDVTSGDEKTQQSALRHLKMMKEAYPDSEFELVIYGKALPMVLKENTAFSEKVQELDGVDQVSIKVCEVTMARFKVDKSQLSEGVRTVPDAIMEIVRKQHEGWAYIKESHN